MRDLPPDRRTVSVVAEEANATRVRRKLDLPATRVAIALAFPFVALALQWTLWSVFDPYVWFLFFPAAFFSAWIGGLVGGAGATLISALLVWYFFIPPVFSFALKEPSAAYSVVVFVVMGGLFAWFHERLRRSMQQADEALVAARAANAEISQLYEKLQKLDEQKSRFFANVSHELRTPLTLVLTPLERRLRQPESAALSESDRHETEIMLRNARLLYRHVTDLLDIAKLDAGHAALSWAGIDLAVLVRAMASHFESLAEESRIDYNVVVPLSLPVEADAEKLQRVLVNLLSNAFKFTPEDGVISLTLQQEGTQARIDVRDNGPGVPEELRAAVFERFHQGEHGMGRRHGGTGLGLSIVKDFVELHGGTIELREAPGGGALFSVRLPLAAPAGTILAAPTQLDEVIDRQTVEELEVRRRSTAPGSTIQRSGNTPFDAPLLLVVEDNVDMNEFIVAALRPHYRVCSAFNGREGLEQALALHPDLIVCDLMMPVMSGDEMVGELRCQPATRDTPVIMITARADEALRLRLLQESVQDYLSKPFSTEELLARISGLLKTRRRTMEELANGAARLRRLAEIVEQVAAVREFQELVAIVCPAVRELTGADGVTLVLRDNGQCHYIEEDAVGPLWRGQRFPMESCISGWVMLHAEPVAIDDIYIDPRIPYAAYRPTFVKSLSMVPIPRENPIGAIGCYWADRHLASDDELELQQAMADAMSVGLTNLDIYREMRDARLAAEQSAATARESERRFHRLFHEAPVPLCYINGDGVLTEFNRRFEQMFGYGKAEIPTQTDWWRLAYPDPDYRDWALATWNAAVANATAAGSDIEPVEYRVMCRNGKARICLVSGIALDKDLLVTFFDVTERRQAEEDLRNQAEELKRRNDELERFNRAATGREIEMIRLKQQVNALSVQSGHEPPYPLTFMDEAVAPTKSTDS